MDVLLDDDEREIRDAARFFLEGECPTSLVRAMEKEAPGYSTTLWASMAELGWIGASLAPEVGGQGMPLTMTGLLLQEVGRHLAPVPLHSTVVAALAVAAHGSPEQQHRWLPDVCAGSAIATFALQDATGSIAALTTRGVPAERDGDDLVLTGVRGFVDNAAIADWLLVPCLEGDGTVSVALVDADAAGLSAVDLVTTAKDKQSRLMFDRVRVTPDRLVGGRGMGPAVVRHLLDHGVALLCAQIAGATRRDVEFAVAYAKERHAFNRPIGSFQALQHLCADMIIWVDGEELLVSEAIWRLSEGLPASIEVSQAKAFASKCLAACRSSQQIHGGIGFMMECDLQLWYRRVAAWSLRLGSSFEHRARIANALLAKRDAEQTPLRIGATLIADE